MLKIFFYLLTLVAAIFLTAAFLYVGGRILAPELGLSVPEYWAWFWLDAIVLVPMIVTGTMGKAALELFD